MRTVSRRRFLSTITKGAVPLAVPMAVMGWSGSVTAAAGEESDYRRLFNGRDLEGWVPVNVAPGTFSVREGLIVSTGIPTGILRTDRHYENFDLELEWRHMVRRGNAGLFIYSEPITAPGVPFSKSIEVQILDGDSPEGVATGHGDIFSIHGARMTPDRPHPRGWERCLPSERRARPFGEWNHYRVESRDGRLTLAVNGKVVSGASGCRPRRGYICLESEGSECHFRNLRIREWPSSNPPAEEVAGTDAGFVSLYTGVGLEGWRAGGEHEGHWQARDWILACDGKGPVELRTVGGWKDADFIVDWRVEGAGRAGVVLGGKTGVEVGLESESNRWHRTQLSVRGDALTVAHDGGALETRRLDAIGSGSLGLRHGGVPVQFANLYVRSNG
jgi:hypothetical protein